MLLSEEVVHLKRPQGVNNLQFTHLFSRFRSGSLSLAEFTISKFSMIEIFLLSSK